MLPGLSSRARKRQRQTDSLFLYLFYYMLVYKSEQNRSSLNVNSSGILFMSTAPAIPFTLPFEVYCHKTYWRSSISVGASR